MKLHTHTADEDVRTHASQTHTDIHTLQVSTKKEEEIHVLSEFNDTVRQINHTHTQLDAQINQSSK